LTINSLNSGNASDVANCARPRLANASENRDHRFDRKPEGAAEPRGGLPRHLQIVVIETDHAETERDREHDPDIGVSRIGPKQGGHHDAEQDHQAAHGRRAGLDEVGFWPVGADRLTLALLDAQVIDDPRAEQEDENQRGQHRPAGSHCEIAKHVEERQCAGKVSQPVEHWISLVPTPKQRLDGSIGGSTP
jgi:hypothetical protein